MGVPLVLCGADDERAKLKEFECEGWGGGEGGCGRQSLG
jgi:hypothetical protein